MSEISRRNFLKGVTGVLGGAAVGYTSYPFLLWSRATAEEITDHPVGNAAYQNMIEGYCRQTPDPNACVDNFQPSTDLKVSTLVWGPLTEELTYRAFPSLLLSFMEERSNPIVDIIFGTRELRSTRQEFISGAATSFLFGVRHNFTDRGFDTKTIPLPQTVSGMIMWYLQRKLGYIAAVTNHTLINARGWGMIR